MQPDITENLEHSAQQTAASLLALLDRELNALRTLDASELGILSEQKQREAGELAAHVERIMDAAGQVSAQLSTLLRQCESCNTRNGILVQQGLRQTEQMLSILHGQFTSTGDLLYQKNGAMLAAQSGISPGISA